MSIINKIVQQELIDNQSKNRTAETNETLNKVQLILPHSGKGGMELITKKKKHIRKPLSKNIQAIVIYQSKKLSAKFHVKDRTEFCYQSNLVYYGKCPNQTCIVDYIGETDGRINGKIIIIINVIRTRTY